MIESKAVAAFRRTAISLAVGMCLSGAVHAQVVDGNIVGKAKGGAAVTLVGPGGNEARATAQPDGTFSFSKLKPGSYKVTSDGVTREVAVAAGVDSRVSLESTA